MNIHEYQAKEMLAKYGIAVPQGVAILNAADIASVINGFATDKYVIKAQIHAGGRGKAGGVKFADNPAAAIEIAQKMYGTTLVTHQTGPDGQKIQRLYIEAGCNIKKEYYLSLVLDRANNCLTFIASTEGGMDIEEVAAASPEKIVKLFIDPTLGVQPFHCRKLTFALGLGKEYAGQMTKLINGLYKLFTDNDASQVEINPLVLTDQDQLMALDGKINFDDNALFKHPEVAVLRDTDEEDPLEIQASNFELNYVRMEGNIGCMVNGAGLAMATMDIIKLYGASPANFLDVGGGATKERVCEAFKIILSDQAVQGILVNIFGGIMRCDIIAEGIVAAAKEVKIQVPLVVRLAGTNVELGKEILANTDLPIITATDLADAANKIVHAI